MTQNPGLPPAAAPRSPADLDAAREELLRLGDWFETDASEENLRILRRFWEEVPVADLEMVERGWKLASDACDGVLRNPHLPSELSASLIHKAMQRIRRSFRNPGPGIRVGSDILFTAFQEGHLSAASRQTREMQRWLERWLEREMEPGREIWRLENVRYLADLLVQCRDLEPRGLLQLVHAEERARGLRACPRLALHPRAELTVWRALARKAREPWDPGIQAIRCIPAACRDAEVRQDLERLSPGRPELLFALCLDAGPEVGRFFRLLGDLAPEEVPALLRSEHFHSLSCLTREDLRPLLSSPDGEVRLAAMLVLARLPSDSRPRSSPPAPQP